MSSTSSTLASSGTPVAGTFNPLQRVLATTDSAAPLLARLTLGLVMFPHGAQKALGWFGGYGFEGTMGFFTGTMHIPAVFAFLAIAAEFAGSIALILGAFSRVAALGIAAVMTVAIATSHLAHGFFMNWTGAQKGEGFEFHLLALGLALIVLVWGGGKASVDRKLVRARSDHRRMGAPGLSRNSGGPS